MTTPSHPAATPRASAPQLRDIITDAIRYWEPRRFAYNAVLAALSVGTVVATGGSLSRMLALEGLIALFVLMVVANVLYCAAYVPDVFVQMSHFRGTWLRFRGALWVVGMVLSALMAAPIAATLGGVSAFLF